MISFGTDGIRGVANLDLTPELALALGHAFGSLLEVESKVLLACDTRISSSMLGAALGAGLASEGVDVIDVGVLPTGVLAHLCMSMSLPGAVISASHNPYMDNGIKLLGVGGRKLSDAEEADLERILIEVGSSGVKNRSSSIGKIRSSDLGEVYLGHILRIVDSTKTKSMRIVVDFSNGAAYPLAGELFRRLGCDVVGVLGDSPNGTNINDKVGSTHPEALAELVVSTRADVGIAFDGDADRLIAVSDKGQIVDGDEMMALFALDMRERGLLRGDAVAVTVMSNMGLETFLAERGIGCVRTNVGDRYVLEMMEERDLALGGEQSGHMIFSDYATTGDGLLSASLLLELVGKKSSKLSDLLKGSFERYPQVLHNIAKKEPSAVLGNSSVVAEVERLTNLLDGRGRILVRASGTEPIVRVMVEAETHSLAKEVALSLQKTIEELS